MIFIARYYLIKAVRNYCFIILSCIMISFSIEARSEIELPYRDAKTDKLFNNVRCSSQPSVGCSCVLFNSDGAFLERSCEMGDKGVFSIIEQSVDEQFSSSFDVEIRRRISIPNPKAKKNDNNVSNSRREPIGKTIEKNEHGKRKKKSAGEIADCRGSVCTPFSNGNQLVTEFLSSLAGARLDRQYGDQLEKIFEQGQLNALKKRFQGFESRKSGIMGATRSAISETKFHKFESPKRADKAELLPQQLSAMEKELNSLLEKEIAGTKDAHTKKVYQTIHKFMQAAFAEQKLGKDAIPLITRIQSASRKIIDQRDQGQSADIVLRDASYYLHGLYSSSSGDWIHAVPAIGSPFYDAAKWAAIEAKKAGFPQFEKKLRTYKNNPVSPPGGYKWAYRGLIDGMLMNSKDDKNSPAKKRPLKRY